jgi:4-carboxymuconolactone decarboxylase
MKIAIGVAAGLLAAASQAQAADRFPELTLDNMTPQQKQVAESIMSGPRKSLSGPFNAWLRSPELGDRLQKVGEYIRFKTSLPPRLNEFAILIAARYWTAQYEWYAHYPLAMKAGLDPNVAASLAAGRQPRGMQDDEKIVYDFCTELRTTRNVSDKTFNAAVAKFGEQGVVDLIGVSGYYDTVSMTLNVARVSVPAGEPLPLKPLKKIEPAAH